MAPNKKHILFLKSQNEEDEAFPLLYLHIVGTEPNLHLPHPLLPAQPEAEIVAAA